MPDREIKEVPFTVNAVDAEGRTFSGLAAIFGNIDLVDDVIHTGAFTKTLTERGSRVKFLWQHDQSEPLGKITSLQETPGLPISPQQPFDEGELAADLPDGRHGKTLKKRYRFLYEDKFPYAS